MPFLDHPSGSDIQWQRYQQLELIPAHVPSPSLNLSPLRFGFGHLWHRLIRLLIAELEAEVRLAEYFERCWELELSATGEEYRNPLQKLWVLMD